MQETRRHLQKFTKMLQQSVKAQLPILQMQELAEMAITQQIPFGTLPSVKFDMASTIQGVFESTITNGNQLNEAVGQLELIA